MKSNNASAASVGIPEVWSLYERLLARERAPESSLRDIATLSAQMAHGDENAFRAFYDRYFNRLFGYLLVLTHGREDAAREALQATMLRVLKHVKRFESEETFWSWLTLLARTALIDQERKRSRYGAFLERFVHETSPAAETHLLECLKQSIAALVPEELDLIERKYFEGESVAQIAVALGISEKAVESRLGRIRQKLKHQTLELLK